jgi:hypothetical protein
LLSETVCVQNIQPISKNFQNIIDKLSSWSVRESS